MATGVGLLLRGIRLGKRLDLQAMSAELGTTPDRLRQVETGTAFPPAGERRGWAAVLGFADLTDFDNQWRSTAASPAFRAVHRAGWIPVVNKAPAGPPVDYEEFGVDTRVGTDYVPRSPTQADEGTLFAVVIVGDSMAPGYVPGDLVVFRPADVDAGRDVLPDGSPVFVRFTADRGHACTVKSLHRRSDGRYDLRPANPAHHAMIVAPWEIDRLAIAVERRPAFCRMDDPVRHVPDEDAQPFPEE
jgi:SOS-response transcriptional repressor LexA